MMTPSEQQSLEKRVADLEKDVLVLKAAQMAVLDRMKVMANMLDLASSMIANLKSMVDRKP